MTDTAHSGGQNLHQQMRVSPPIPGVSCGIKTGLSEEPEGIQTAMKCKVEEEMEGASLSSHRVVTANERVWKDDEFKDRRVMEFKNNKMSCLRFISGYFRNEMYEMK